MVSSSFAHFRKRNIVPCFYLPFDISIYYLDSSFGLWSNIDWPIQVQGSEMFLVICAHMAKA